MTDMWNNVTAYGPAAEIDRFKRLCIDPSQSVYTASQSGWDGCDCIISVPAAGKSKHSHKDGNGRFEYVHNFQQFITETPGEYSFSFDTDGHFPNLLFNDLAERFPKLAFDCACIQAMDECMGFGWFNAPPGGENFRQDYDVPENYWTGGRGYKRSPAAQVAHEARVDKLQEAARQYDGKAPGVNV